MNARDFDAVTSLVDDEVAFDFPGTGRVEGLRRTLLLLKSIFRKYPDLTFFLTEIISEGDRACAVWTNHGHSTDGNTYRNSGVTLLHFSGERITFISDYFKDTSFA